MTDSPYKWHICDDLTVKEWPSALCSSCRMHKDDSRHFKAGDVHGAVRALRIALARAIWDQPAPAGAGAEGGEA